MSTLMDFAAAFDVDPRLTVSSTTRVVEPSTSRVVVERKLVTRYALELGVALSEEVALDLAAVLRAVVLDRPAESTTRGLYQLAATIEDSLRSGGVEPVSAEARFAGTHLARLGRAQAPAAIVVPSVVVPPEQDPSIAEAASAPFSGPIIPPPSQMTRVDASAAPEPRQGFAPKFT